MHSHIIFYSDHCPLKEKTISCRLGNVQYVIPILSVYRFSFDNYKGKFFNGSLKEILSNSKRENDDFEAVSNMFRTTCTYSV